MVVDALMKDEIIEIFEGLLENSSQAKSLTKENSENIKALAEKLNMKGKEVRATFRIWKDNKEKGMDTLEPINSLLVALEA